ncbi:MAG: M20 family peptidase, partial [Gammaproteobacteria bacterium]|nr:M20 family peptidase [Gammaproteobacteria bacterium]
MDTLKKDIVAFVDSIAEDLLEVSHEIHAHPELAFEEHQAAAVLTSAIERFDLPVERGSYGLETAFEAKFETAAPGPSVAVLAEYDALPGIGHSCGHNLIATSALGAALALSHLRDQLCGTVTLL